MAYVSVEGKLSKMGGKCTLRMSQSKAGPVITDNGMFVLDVDFGPIQDPVSLDIKLHSIPGIVETGLFCGMADGVYYGMEDG
jgi:ribose 5-phosphate isomerase A